MIHLDQFIKNPQSCAAEVGSDKETVLEAVKKRGPCLRFASPDLRNDREVVLAAVSHNGLALFYASDAMKADRDVCLAAAEQNFFVIGESWFPAPMKADRELVLSVVSRCGDMLRYAAHELKSDVELVKVAVKQDGGAFGLASASARSHKDVLLTAVANFGNKPVEAHPLRLAGAEMKADRDVVLRSVRSHGCALQYAADSLKSDKEIVKIAVRQHGASLAFASTSLQSDKETVFAAINSKEFSLDHAKAPANEDREIVLAGLKHNPANFQFVPESLRADREVCLVAVAGAAPDNFKLVSPALQADPVLRFLHGGITNYEDLPVVLEAISWNGECIKYAAQQIKADKEVALRAVTSRGKALASLSKGLQGDREVVLAAMRSDPAAIAHASPELRKLKDELLLEVQDVQLLTLHPMEEEDGLVPFLVTAMGGEELAHIRADPSKQVSALLSDIDADIGPGARRFMLPDGRVLQIAEEKRILSEWLSGER